MECSKCGGMLKVVNETTMKCEGCGNIVHTDHKKEEGGEDKK